jgi:hypothetical protein
MEWTDARIRKAKSDVERVKKNARWVVYAEKMKKPLIQTDCVSYNPEGRLDVIAVIGPTYLSGSSFNQGLITEVGIGRGRPFNEATGKDRKEWQSNIAKRRNFFPINPKKYHLLGECIFDIIKFIARERVEKRACSHFYISEPKRKWIRSKKRIAERDGWRSWPRGVRFSISKKDTLLLADVYHAELNFLRESLSKTAKFIDLRLAVLRERKRITAEVFSEAMSDVVLNVSGMSGYQKKALLEYLPKGKRNFFFLDIIDHFKIPLAETQEEKILSSIMDFPEARHKHVNLKVISGLDNGKGYIVVEVFPYVDEIYLILVAFAFWYPGKYFPINPGQKMLQGGVWNAFHFDEQAPLIIWTSRYGSCAIFFYRTEEAGILIICWPTVWVSEFCFLPKDHVFLTPIGGVWKTPDTKIA